MGGSGAKNGHGRGDRRCGERDAWRQARRRRALRRRLTRHRERLERRRKGLQSGDLTRYPAGRDRAARQLTEHIVERQRQLQAGIPSPELHVRDGERERRELRGHDRPVHLDGALGQLCEDDAPGDGDPVRLAQALGNAVERQRERGRGELARDSLESHAHDRVVPRHLGSPPPRDPASAAAAGRWSRRRPRRRPRGAVPRARTASRRAASAWRHPPDARAPRGARDAARTRDRGTAPARGPWPAGSGNGTGPSRANA